MKFLIITAVILSTISSCSKPEELREVSIKKSSSYASDDINRAPEGDDSTTAASRYLPLTLSHENPLLDNCSQKIENIGFRLDKSFSFGNALFMASLFNGTEDLNKNEMEIHLEKLGFPDFKWIENSSKGVFAFIAERDEFAVVHFRGTSNIGGWIQDAKFFTRRANGKDPTNLIRLDDGLDLDGWLHSGFYGSYETVMSEFERKLSDVNKSKPLYFAGHSLGGALTAIAAARAAINDHNVHATYTAGQPRIGDNSFSISMDEKLDGRHYRMVFEDDMVARIPPRRNSANYFSEIASKFELLRQIGETAVQVAGYTHHSKAINLTQKLVNEGLVPPSAFYDQLFWKNWSSQLSSISEIVTSKIIKDHESKNYSCSIIKLIQTNSSLID
jgi:hypothetical protein